MPALTTWIVRHSGGEYHIVVNCLSATEAVHRTFHVPPTPEHSCRPIRKATMRNVKRLNDILAEEHGWWTFKERAPQSFFTEVPEDGRT